MVVNLYLSCFYFDYNNIGDYGVGIFFVVLAVRSFLERVDLEGCGIGEKGGEMFFIVVVNYSIKLVEFILFENKISVELIG